MSRTRSDGEPIYRKQEPISIANGLASGISLLRTYEHEDCIVCMKRSHSSPTGKGTFTREGKICLIGCRFVCQRD